MAFSRKASVYNLIEDYTDVGGDQSEISISPYWALCIIRLGLPLSYSRETNQSVTTDVSQGSRLRGPSLIVSSDCKSLMIAGSKESHTKTLTAELIQTDHNYLVEILPGDWILGWILNNETDFKDLLQRIQKQDVNNPCNHFTDGFKFLGRVDAVRKHMRLDKASGMKTSTTTVSAIGFRELDSMFFYDNNLSEQQDLNLGSWLAKIGLKLESLFAVDIKNGQKNNGRVLIESIIDVIVGKGVSPNVNQTNREIQINSKNGYGSVQAGTGAGATTTGQAPFAYLVPASVGRLLGKKSKVNDGLYSYANILDTLMGIQSYSAQSNNINGSFFNPTTNTSFGNIFNPDINLSQSTGNNRIFTGKELLGTFIPNMPEFTNKPLWSILQQFLNPTVNEMYTCLRVDRFGFIVPTLVVRQIPFTTEPFAIANDNIGKSPGPLVANKGTKIEVTPFLTLPRWLLHPTMVNDIDLGRSDATRTNFVHIYGQDSNSAEQVTFTSQLVNNPPIRDDLDIQRSGMRTYMTTVACATRDSVGQVPSTWMRLVADWMIGSQYTLNGTIQSIGIHSPICEGDNLEWDGTVFHIESVAHVCSINPEGTKTFTTTLTVTNGLRSDAITDVTVDQPGYPGMLPDDVRKYDPGISIDDDFDRTPPDFGNGDLSLVDPSDPNLNNQPQNVSDIPPDSSTNKGIG